MKGNYFMMQVLWTDQVKKLVELKVIEAPKQVS